MMPSERGTGRAPDDAPFLLGCHDETIFAFGQGVEIAHFIVERAVVKIGIVAEDFDTQPRQMGQRISQILPRESRNVHYNGSFQEMDNAAPAELTLASCYYNSWERGLSHQTRPKIYLITKKR